MLDVSTPKISCLTATTGRLECLKKSIRCYLNQTYPNRELIVLSQSPEDNRSIREYIETIQRRDILFFEAAADLTLGSMRNALCEIATGTILCQWDDDDLYHPDRIRSQYLALSSDDRAVGTAYSQFLKLFSDNQELYWCDWWGEGRPTSQLLCGSVMFYKSFFHDWGSLLYPESGSQCHVEEDLNVLEKLTEAGMVLPVSLGYQYIYVFHGGNTYGLPHHRLALDISSGKMVLDRDALLVRQSILQQTFECVGLDKVYVRSLDEICFEYSSKA